MCGCNALNNFTRFRNCFWPLVSMCSRFQSEQPSPSDPGGSLQRGRSDHRLWQFCELFGSSGDHVWWVIVVWQRSSGWSDDPVWFFTSNIFSPQMCFILWTKTSQEPSSWTWLRWEHSFLHSLDAWFNWECPKQISVSALIQDKILDLI